MERFRYKNYGTVFLSSEEMILLKEILLDQVVVVDREARELLCRVIVELDDKLGELLEEFQKEEGTEDAVSV